MLNASIFKQLDRQLEFVMHDGSFSDVIISLHTELAELIKLRAADRILWGIKCRPGGAYNHKSLFCPSGLKGLTIIYKFLSYISTFTISLTYIVNILVSFSRQFVPVLLSLSFISLLSNQFCYLILRFLL